MIRENSDSCVVIKRNRFIMEEHRVGFWFQSMRNEREGLMYGLCRWYSVDMSMSWRGTCGFSVQSAAVMLVIFMTNSLCVCVGGGGGGGLVSGGGW